MGWLGLTPGSSRLVAMLTPPGSLNGSTGTLEGLAAALDGDGVQELAIDPMADITGGRLMPGAPDAKNTSLGLFSTIARQSLPLFTVIEPTFHDKSFLWLMVPWCL